MPRNGLDAKLQLRLPPALMARLNAKAVSETAKAAPGVVITRSDIVRDLLDKHLPRAVQAQAPPEAIDLDEIMGRE